VYNVASSSLGVNCGVGGSLIKKKTDYTGCIRIRPTNFQRRFYDQK
jgi:hypothetical protein